MAGITPSKTIMEAFSDNLWSSYGFMVVVGDVVVVFIAVECVVCVIVVVLIVVECVVCVITITEEESLIVDVIVGKSSVIFITIGAESLLVGVVVGKTSVRLTFFDEGVTLTIRIFVVVTFILS